VEDVRKCTAGVNRRLLESELLFRTGQRAMEQGRSELQKIFTEALKNAPVDQAPVLAWPMVCGASVAKKTRALDFARGLLRVQVPDKAWRTELEALSGDYVRAINDLVQNKVARIEFVVPIIRKHELEVRGHK
jgi:Dna[CI] antecedent, DciA